MVVVSAPLGDVVQNHDASGRMAKWATKLMGCHITYVPRTAIKSQVLVDFIAEWTKVQMAPPLTCQEYWTLYLDGSLMAMGMGARVVLISLMGDCMEYAI